MTLTQLEYLVALDTHRHFGVASERCRVSQPTLSMQIQKLESELGVKIFDRSKQPVIPTEIGNRIISQARNVLREARLIPQIIRDQEDTLSGELRLGIIPTIAPYLLPPLYKALRLEYPQLNLVVREITTEGLVQELKSNRIDCGIVVTPLKDSSLREEVLFYEELFVYLSRRSPLVGRERISESDLGASNLWLLEEGHCFRSQMLNLCKLKDSEEGHFKYEAGNLETLKRMVDQSDGLTILPELAVMELKGLQRKLVKQLEAPRPVREVSLVTHRDQIKTRLLQTLKSEILSAIPASMQKLSKKRVIELDYRKQE